MCSHGMSVAFLLATIVVLQCSVHSTPVFSLGGDKASPIRYSIRIEHLEFGNPEGEDSSEGVDYSLIPDYVICDDYSDEDYSNEDEEDDDEDDDLNYIDYYGDEYEDSEEYDEYEEEESEEYEEEEEEEESEEYEYEEEEEEEEEESEEYEEEEEQEEEEEEEESEEYYDSDEYYDSEEYSDSDEDDDDYYYEDDDDDYHYYEDRGYLEEDQKITSIQDQVSKRDSSLQKHNSQQNHAKKGKKNLIPFPTWVPMIIEHHHKHINDIKKNTEYKQEKGPSKSIKRQQVKTEPRTFKHNVHKPIMHRMDKNIGKQDLQKILKGLPSNHQVVKDASVPDSRVFDSSASNPSNHQLVQKQKQAKHHNKKGLNIPHHRHVKQSPKLSNHQPVQKDRTISEHKQVKGFLKPENHHIAINVQKEISPKEKIKSESS